MNSDLLSVVLGIVIVLIFMAIFTLIRTMNSPFIHRYRYVVKGKVEPLNFPKNSYHILFEHEGRSFEILEIKYESMERQKTVYNNYIYLRVKVNSRLAVRFQDGYEKLQFRYIFDDLFPAQAKYEELVNRDLPHFYADYKVFTNDPASARKFLEKIEVRDILSGYKIQFVYYGYLIPVFLEPEWITLDFSLMPYYLNEIIDNPQELKKHIKQLNKLAALVEQSSGQG